MEKKLSLLKCGVASLGMHAGFTFFWTAFLAMGVKSVVEAQSSSIAPNGSVSTVLSSSGISALLDRMLTSQVYIAIFSAIFGFSFLIFKVKRLSDAAKYSIHIILNYVSVMVCFYALHASGSSGAAAQGWIALLLVLSVVFFVVYGVVALVARLVKNKK